MDNQSEAILIPQGGDKDKVSFAQRFRERLIYPFQKKRFYKQWADAPMDIRFRLTNKCNEKCSRCFECSGPDNPLNVIPLPDIKFYTNYPDARFQQICMTGGEWSLIYDVQPHYLRTVFDGLDLSHSDEYIIQTNARWINGAHRTEILDDIKHIQSKLGAKNKMLKLDMSVDRYRSRQSLDAVRDVVLAVASDAEFNNTKIRIMSCALDAQMANDCVLRPEFFEPRGVNLSFENRTWFNPYFQICYANKTRIVIHEEGPTMSIGRAKQNGFGYKIYEPQLQCGGLQPDNTLMELSLREDGMIKWHNWYDWNIMVPYKDSNGQNKPLEQIRNELVDMAWVRLLRHNIKNMALNMLPVFGAARQIHINNQIKKTYESNCKVFKHIAVPIKEL